MINLFHKQVDCKDERGYLKFVVFPRNKYWNLIN